jgi:hypothetical protein
MSPENNQKLLDMYPEIFSNIHYCGVGDGWFDLINNACRMIQDHLHEEKEVDQVVAMQVKEKFGGLRFYIHGGDDFCYNVIESTEAASMHICEVCGTAGELRPSRRWLKTLCDEHAKQD